MISTKLFRAAFRRTPAHPFIRSRVRANLVGVIAGALASGLILSAITAGLTDAFPRILHDRAQKIGIRLPGAAAGG
jgi:hypothetical protein